MGRGGKVDLRGDHGSSSQQLSSYGMTLQKIEKIDSPEDGNKAQREKRKICELVESDDELDELSDEDMNDIEEIVEFARRYRRPTNLITPELHYRTLKPQQPCPERREQISTEHCHSFVALSAPLKGPNDFFEDE